MRCENVSEDIIALLDAHHVALDGVYDEAKARAGAGNLIYLIRRYIAAQTAAGGQRASGPVRRIRCPSRGAHEPALQALQEVARRRAVAAFFNVAPLEVAFSCNATAALNMAIKGALTPKDRVLTTPYSHNSMLRPLYEMQDKGMELDIMPLSEDGLCTAEGFARHLRENTTAIALNPMSNAETSAGGGHCLVLSGFAPILDLSQWAGTRSMPKIVRWPRTLMLHRAQVAVWTPGYWWSH